MIQFLVSTFLFIIPLQFSPKNQFDTPYHSSNQGMSGTHGDKDSDAGTLFHQNFLDTVVILEEGNLPHPQCPRCNILVPWRALNGGHITTAQCSRRAESNQRRMTDEELR